MYRSEKRDKSWRLDEWYKMIADKLHCECSVFFISKVYRQRDTDAMVKLLGIPMSDVFVNG